MKDKNKFKKYICYAMIGVTSGVLNGLFGAGGGCVVVPAMEKFLDMDEKKSHATAIAVIFLMSAVSSVLYIRGGWFDFSLWLPVTLGGLIGGALGGSVIAMKMNNSVLRRMFGVFLLFVGIREIIKKPKK